MKTIRSKGLRGAQEMIWQRTHSKFSSSSTIANGTEATASSLALLAEPSCGGGLLIMLRREA